MSAEDWIFLCCKLFFLVAWLRQLSLSGNTSRFACWLIYSGIKLALDCEFVTVPSVSLQLPIFLGDPVDLSMVCDKLVMLFPWKAFLYTFCRGGGCEHGLYQHCFQLLHPLEIKLQMSVIHFSCQVLTFNFFPRSACVQISATCTNWMWLVATQVFTAATFNS